MQKKLIQFIEKVIQLNPKLGVRLDNPIVELFNLEAQFADKMKPGQFDKAQHNFKALMKDLTNELSNLPDKSTVEKIQMAYQLMGKSYQLIDDEKSWDKSLLSTHLSHKKLDCDAASFIIAALSHELGWKNVNIITVPGHAFIDCDGVYLDSGKVEDASYFKAEYNLPRDVNLREAILKPIEKIESLYLLNMAMTKARLGQHSAAIQDYDKSLALNPDSEITFLSRAHSYASIGELSAAIRDYTHALALNPNSEDGWFNQGNVYFQLEQYTDAIEAYDKVLKLNSFNTDAFSNRAESKYNLGRYADAIRDYNIILDRNPKNEDALIDRGIAKFDLEQYADAIKDFEKALDLNPDNVDALFNLGLAKARLGKFQEAVVAYHRALSFDKRYDDIFFNQGMANLSLGNYGEAVNDFDQAIKINPDNEEAISNRELAREKLSVN